MTVFFLFYYFSWIIFVSGFIYISDVLSNKNKILSRFSIFCAFLVFSLDAYFKGERGRDSVAYRDHYNLILNNGGWFPDQGPYDFEPGYNYFIFFLGKFGFSYDVLAFLINGLSFFFIFFISRAFNISKYNLLFLFVLSGFLFFSYNGVRQWLALVLVYLSIGVWFSGKKRLKAIVLSGFGFLLHKSSVLFIGFSYSLRYLSRLKSDDFILVFFSIVPVVALIFYVGREFVSQSLGYDNYLNAIELFNYDGVGYGWLLQVLINIVFLVILFSRKKQLGILELLALVWVVLYLVAPLDQTVMRLARYFEFAQVLVFASVNVNAFLSNFIVSFLIYSLMVVKFVIGVISNSNGAILG